MEMPLEFPQLLLPAASWWCWALAWAALIPTSTETHPRAARPPGTGRQTPASHKNPKYLQFTAPQTQGKQKSAFGVCNVIQTPPCLGQETSRGRAPKSQDNFKPGEMKVPARNPANPVLPKHPPRSPALDSHNENKCSNAYSNSLQMRWR